MLVVLLLYILAIKDVVLCDEVACTWVKATSQKGGEDQVLQSLSATGLH